MAILEVGVPESCVKVANIIEQQTDAVIGNLSPWRVVPVLALPDGSAIADSAVILRHIMDSTTRRTSDIRRPAPARAHSTCRRRST